MVARGFPDLRRFERHASGAACRRYVVRENRRQRRGYCWGNIISFQPDKHLAYDAQVVPPWGGPAQSVVQIALEPGETDPEHTTRLTLTDSLIGHVHDELLGCLDEGWRQLFGDGGLKTFAEGM